ncbi:zf-CCHC domain-containing protein [Tanacetum coccineum]
MCNTTKEIWKTLIITHQGNSQVKDNKIDLLVQQYEQFVISKDESIDSAFARFNTIITSLKALDEGYSSKNYVRKFLRALHPKWRAKVTAIEESKELTSLSLDELIGNLKVHEMIIKKDSEIVKQKCGDPNHLIRECPKPPKDKNQRAFVGGSWSDSGEEDDEKVKDETCLVAHASSEVCSESSYFSDENSSIDDIALDNEYDNPSAVRSYGGNRYILVIVDDYSRYTWTRFLKDKTKAFDHFKIFKFCNANGITHNFSAPRTPQSNGAVERKNRTLQEMIPDDGDDITIDAIPLSTKSPTIVVEF